MASRNLIGWLSLALFVSAAICLTVLIPFKITPVLEVSISINPQLIIVADSVLAFAACILGFYAKTPQGQIGAIGGLVLIIVSSVFLSLTLISSYEIHTTWIYHSEIHAC
jgi:hypothetical protein